MLLAYPIFLDQGREFWLDEAGLGLMPRFWERFRRLPGVHREAVCTDAPAVAEQARAHGLEALLLPPCFAGEGSPEAAATLPELDAAGRCLRALLQAQPEGTGAPGQDADQAGPGAALLLDVSNPLLDRATVLGALERFRAEGRDAASWQTPADHPCQFNSYFRVLEAGLLHLLAPGAPVPDLPGLEPGRWVSTRAFPFAWGDFVWGEPAGPHLCEGGDLGPVLRPLADFGGAVPPGCGGLLLPEGPRAARLLLPAQALAGLAGGGQVEACAFSLLEGPRAPLVLRQPGVEPRLVLPDLSALNGRGAGALLALQPLDGHGPLLGAGTRLCRDEAGAWPAPPQPPGNATAWAFSLVVQAGDAPSSAHEPFCPPDAGWTVDPHSLVRVNTATGRPIHGRQDFPDVLEFDGSLLLAGPEGVRALAQGRWEDYLALAEVLRLPQQRVMRVNSLLGLLRAAIRGQVAP